VQKTLNGQDFFDSLKLLPLCYTIFETFSNIQVQGGIDFSEAVFDEASGM
jgi:hypothetical protein